MRAEIAWWELDGSPQTVDSLQAQLDEPTVLPWGEVPGLMVKFWIADLERNRWGAVMLWGDERPDNAELPPNRAAELIGFAPTHRFTFDVESLVPGPCPILPATGSAAQERTADA
ncbi:hypothetical protein [Actinopolyspora saharensis]|uniref:Trans-2,3-dihydro-3-hydroxyanthranilate isomerase n=1 Tax=Actinopolyspora saharensis TaxID=995062 RepID=A0A1H1FC59_9ACTN|nr:hypothetical protein [Actinopolyspora saharensis]SDQ98046.1 trans-2,3-dihydro-3-hydroxyanthranilate isomerase [Actinopolyspora saharensis]